MAKQELKFCIKCSGFTLHEWVVDNEIQHEPLFNQMCLRCEGADDTLISKLESGQQTL